MHCLSNVKCNVFSIFPVRLDPLLEGLISIEEATQVAAAKLYFSTLKRLTLMRIAILAAIGIGTFLLVFLPGYFFLLPSGSEVPEMVAPADEESES